MNRTKMLSNHNGRHHCDTIRKCIEYRICSNCEENMKTIHNFYCGLYNCEYYPLCTNCYKSNITFDTHKEKWHYIILE